MKKNILLSFLLLITFSVFSQSKLSGIIQNKPNIELEIRVNEGSADIVRKTIKTDKTGAFSTDLDFNGLYRLKLADKKKDIILLSASGENTQVNYSSSNFKVISGKSNLFIESFIDNYFKNQNKVYLIDELLKLEKRDQTFKSTLQNKKLSINQENIDFDNQINSIVHPDVKYFTNLVKFLPKLQESQVKNLTTAKFNRTKIEKILVNDGELLEQSGYMGYLINSHYEMLKYIYAREIKANGDADAQRQFKVKVLEDANKLVDQIDLETDRGQDVAYFYIKLFERNGLEEPKVGLSQRILDLTCEVPQEILNLAGSHVSLSVGKKAPNIVFTEEKKGAKNLYDIKSNYKLVVFWASWCGHCRKEVPKIAQQYAELQSKGIEVIAVSADTEKEDYENFIKDFQWISHCDYKKWESIPFRSYNIKSTPTMYLLGANDIIISKGSRLSKVLEAIK